MKNFTEEQKYKFVINFLLVHGYMSKNLFTNNQRVFFIPENNNPFHLVLLNHSATPKNISIEDLVTIPYTTWGHIHNYCLVPNLITNSKYNNTPAEKQALMNWVEKSKEFAHNYLHEKKSNDYDQKQAVIFNQLTNLAMNLWNTITFESEDYKSFDNCLNEQFWSALKSAKYYPRVTYSDERYNMSYEQFESEIINSFENIQDIINFEEYIINVPVRYNVWDQSNTTLQEEFWYKIMKKLIKKNSLTEMTPLLKEHKEFLENNCNLYSGYKAQELMSRLKTLEFVKYEILEEFYKNLLLTTHIKSMKDYLNKIIKKHNE